MARLRPLGSNTGTQRFSDFWNVGVTAQYKVAAMDRHYGNRNCRTRECLHTELSDDELLTMLQEACFRYYWKLRTPLWDGAREYSGMTGWLLRGKRLRDYAS